MTLDEGEACSWLFAVDATKLSARRNYGRLISFARVRYMTSTIRLVWKSDSKISVMLLSWSPLAKVLCAKAMLLAQDAAVELEGQST